MIVEDLSNLHYYVDPLAQHLDHAFVGAIPVKNVGGEWLPKAKAQPRLLRKAGCRTVELVDA